MKSDYNVCDRMLNRWGCVKSRLYGEYNHIASAVLGLPPEDYDARELLENGVDRRSFRLSLGDFGPMFLE